MQFLKCFGVILIGILGNTLWNQPLRTLTYLQYSTFLMFPTGSHIFIHFRQARVGQDAAGMLYLSNAAGHQVFLVWYGKARYGMVWYGMAWLGMVWFGLVWFRIVCRPLYWISPLIGPNLSQIFGPFMLCYSWIWFGLVWFGMVWYGIVWFGVVWEGLAWYRTLNSGWNL